MAWNNRARSKWIVRATLAQIRRSEASIEGRIIRFRDGEYAVLLALILSPATHYLKRTEIIERVWPNPDQEPEHSDSIVKLYIGDLRKLGVPIETKRGFGYRVPPENRSQYTSRRIVSVASPHCVSAHSSRNNRGRIDHGKQGIERLPTVANRPRKKPC